jgi:hypothetical protein
VSCRYLWKAVRIVCRARLAPMQTQGQVKENLAHAMIAIMNSRKTDAI